MPRRPVVLVTPLAPDRTGNGLAMRAGVLLESLAAVAPVHLVVVPVSGGARLSGWARATVTHVVTVPPVDDLDVARAHVTAQLGDGELRHRLARSEPLPVRVRLVPPTLADTAADALGSETGGSVVVAVREYLAPFGTWLARKLEAVRLVIDLDDDAETLLHSLGHHDEAAAYGRLAGAWLGEADAVTLASASEAASVAERHGLTHVEHVPNAVRLPDRPPPPAPGDDRLLFVGNLTYEPNVAAARLLVHEVLPEVRRRRPRAALQIVGPHDDRIELLASDHVLLAGRVADVGATYAAADVCVAPLRYAAGTRIKVLEALAHRRPAVVSTAAVAGLGLRDGVELLVRDGPAATAAAVIELLDSPERSAALAGAGFATVSANHTVEAVAPLIRRVVLGDAGAEPRSEET